MSYLPFAEDVPVAQSHAVLDEHDGKRVMRG
jgi:hypothetical protein